MLILYHLGIVHVIGPEQGFTVSYLAMINGQTLIIILISFPESLASAAIPIHQVGAQLSSQVSLSPIV